MFNGNATGLYRGLSVFVRSNGTGTMQFGRRPLGSTVFAGPTDTGITVDTAVSVIHRQVPSFPVGQTYAFYVRNGVVYFVKKNLDTENSWLYPVALPGIVSYLRPSAIMVKNYNVCVYATSSTNGVYENCTQWGIGNNTFDSFGGWAQIPSMSSSMPPTATSECYPAYMHQNLCTTTLRKYLYAKSARPDTDVYVAIDVQ
jgi:hypothetical protein